MCHPAIVYGAIALSTVVSAGAAIHQGQVQSDIADANARLQRFAAKDALARGAVEEQRIRERASIFAGRQRAILAASGVQLDTGSALDILEDTARTAELDALTRRANAEREAFGLSTQAGISETQSDAFRTGSYFQAGSTILGGATQAAVYANR